MSDTNFLPNITCPHCGRSSPVAISGFGGRLNLRQKTCRFCNKDFDLIVFAEALPKDDPIPHEETDGFIGSLKLRIKHLRDKRRETLAELLVKHEICQKIYQESLEAARQMRAKAESN